jgi:hypothetical protein
MSRRKKHRPGLEDLLERYADTRYLDLKRYNSGAQIAVIDKDYTRIDIWLTGNYHIVYNKVYRITKHRKAVARSNERGTLPVAKVELGRFLDHIFFDADVLEERRLANDQPRNPN